MSTKPIRHRTTVRKYKRHPSLGGKPIWWSDCACGWFQGWHNKLDALTSADEHLRRQEVPE